MKHESQSHRESDRISLGDVKQTYRRYASVYDILFGWVLQDGRDQLLAAINRLSPRSILEMGVGTGLLLPHYPKEARVVGVDISDEMLAHARARVQQHGLASVTLQQCDCEHLDYADGTFDCVVLPYVLSVTPDPQALLKEALRLCRTGGMVVIVNHFSGAPLWHALERLASPLAAKIGFRSTFSFDDVFAAHQPSIEAVKRANLFGLSKLVLLRSR
ncbi:MAG: class I SAM-dependent methyltransferase [Burkholderiales bacterium]|nr:class I SAM-dependent methyltransferase [Burkholderiales bacterium]